MSPKQRTIMVPGMWDRLASVLGLAVMLAAVALNQPAQAQTFTVLQTFTGPNGQYPQARPNLDAKGNLYGTTSFGGSATNGVLFEIDTTGHESVLYNFSDPPLDDPQAGVVRDAAGNIYGTTSSIFTDCGSVYKVSGSGQATVLHAFTGKSDGCNPMFASLVRDTKGNLYGVTAGDLFHPTNCGNNCGTLFKVDTRGNFTVLHTFGKRTGDGWIPFEGLVRDSNGNFYGSTGCGGANGLGTVYKRSAVGKYQVLYSFHGPGSCAPGSAGGPIGSGSLVLDVQGNLYGSTYTDGKYGFGMVFKLNTSGKITVLHNFKNGADGSLPWSGLVKDAAGNLYGAANKGGAAGAGTVFEVKRNGTFKVLYSFTDGSDGGSPFGVVLDKAGNLYGTTGSGGDPTCKCGTVFKLTR